MADDSPPFSLEAYPSKVPDVLISYARWFPVLQICSPYFVHPPNNLRQKPLERLPKVTTLLEEGLVRPLFREGESAIFFWEAEEAFAI